MANCAGCGKKKPIISMGWKFFEKEEGFGKELGKSALRAATGVSYKRGWWVCPDCKKRIGR